MTKRSATKAKPARAVYRITFDLEVNLSPEEAERHRKGLDEGNELIVEEAVTAVIDEELSQHGDEPEAGTRCGVSFHDATMFSAKFVEVRE